MALMRESRAVRLDIVCRPAGVTQVYISGGQLRDESVWSPSNDVVRGRADTLFLKPNRQSSQLLRFCGKKLIGLKWLDELAAMRNAKCSEVADQAEKSIDPSQRVKSSKRSLCACHDFPELVLLSVQAADGESEFLCPVLFTLDCRHSVAIKLDEATLACVAACMSQCDVQSTRSKKRPRAEWVSLKHPELLWSYQRSAVYVVYSDADGQWHRRFKKPYSARPEDDNTREALIEDASNELHMLYIEHHKGHRELRTAPEHGEVTIDDSIESTV